MIIFAALYGTQMLLCTEESVTLTIAYREEAIELCHQQLGGKVINLPKRHEQCLGTCFLKASLQPEDPLARNIAKPRLTG